MFCLLVVLVKLSVLAKCTLYSGSSLKCGSSSGWMSFLTSPIEQTNTQLFTCQMPFLSPNQQCQSIKKLVPWGTDGRLPLSDLDLGSSHTAYRRASLIDLPTYQISIEIGRKNFSKVTTEVLVKFRVT